MYSPLELFLRAFDALDADACAALFAEHGRLRHLDGRVEEGPAAVGERLREYFAHLRSTTHTLREHWHEDCVWIGEVQASYVLTDESRLGPVPKVFILRMAGEGIEDLRVYAARGPSTHQATEAGTVPDPGPGHGILVDGRWLPPL